MDVFLDCLPCFLRQVLEASRLATDNREIQEKIMVQAIDLLSNYKNYRYAPEIGRQMHQIVKDCTENADPYLKIKKDSIDTAVKLFRAKKVFI